MRWACINVMIYDLPYIYTGFVIWIFLHLDLSKKMEARMVVGVSGGQCLFMHNVRFFHGSLGFFLREISGKSHGIIFRL